MISPTCDHANKLSRFLLHCQIKAERTALPRARPTLNYYRLVFKIRVAKISIRRSVKSASCVSKKVVLRQMALASYVLMFAGSPQTFIGYATAQDSL